VRLLELTQKSRQPSRRGVGSSLPSLGLPRVARGRPTVRAAVHGSCTAVPERVEIQALVRARWAGGPPFRWFRTGLAETHTDLRVR
jgi:hypothetical protein